MEIFVGRMKSTFVSEVPTLVQHTSSGTLSLWVKNYKGQKVQVTLTQEDVLHVERSIAELRGRGVLAPPLEVTYDRVYRAKGDKVDGQS